MRILPVNYSQQNKQSHKTDNQASFKAILPQKVIKTFAKELPLTQQKPFLNRMAQLAEKIKKINLFGDEGTIRITRIPKEDKEPSFRVIAGLETDTFVAQGSTELRLKEEVMALPHKDDMAGELSEGEQAIREEAAKALALWSDVFNGHKKADDLVSAIEGATNTIGEDANYLSVIQTKLSQQLSRFGVEYSNGDELLAAIKKHMSAKENAAFIKTLTDGFSTLERGKSKRIIISPEKRGSFIDDELLADSTQLTRLVVKVDGAPQKETIQVEGHWCSPTKEGYGKKLAEKVLAAIQKIQNS